MSPIVSALPLRIAVPLGLYSLQERFWAWGVKCLLSDWDNRSTLIVKRLVLNRFCAAASNRKPVRPPFASGAVFGMGRKVPAERLGQSLYTDCKTIVLNRFCTAASNRSPVRPPFASGAVL